MDVKVTVEFYIENFCTEDELNKSHPKMLRPQQLEKITNDVFDIESIVDYMDKVSVSIIDVVELSDKF